MSKSNAIGTTLTVNSKTVGGLTSINGIEINADSIDVSALDNATGYREKVPGFKDVGDLTCSGFLDGSDAGQAEMLSLLNSGNIVSCTIVFPATIGKTWSFQASVIRFSTGAEVGNAVTFECSLAVTGQPTLAASTSAG